MAGLAAAVRVGCKGGRPAVMTPERVKLARQLYDAREQSVESIAKTLGVSRRTLYRHLGRPVAVGSASP